MSPRWQNKKKPESNPLQITTIRQQSTKQSSSKRAQEDTEVASAIQWSKNHTKRVGKKSSILPASPITQGDTAQCQEETPCPERDFSARKSGAGQAASSPAPGVLHKWHTLVSLHPETSVAETSRDSQEREGRAGAVSIRLIVGVTLIPSSLLFNQSQLPSPLRTSTASPCKHCGHWHLYHWELCCRSEQTYFTPAAFITEETHGQHRCYGPLQLLAPKVPQVFHPQTPAAWVPLVLLHHICPSQHWCTCPAWHPHWQPSLDSVWVTTPV